MPVPFCRAPSQCSRQLFVIAALLLFVCFGCCDADFHLSQFNCATKDTHGFKVLNGGLMIESTDVEPENKLSSPLFGFQKKENFVVEIVVAESCKDSFNGSTFHIGVNICTKEGPKDVSALKECPRSVGNSTAAAGDAKCKSIIVTCPLKTTRVVEDSEGRVFKVNMGNIKGITKSLCSEWRAYIDGVRLMIDSSADGEPCAIGAGAGFPIWAIVLIMAGFLFLLGAGAVAAFILIRRRRAAQQLETPGLNSATLPLSNSQVKSGIQMAPSDNKSSAASSAVSMKMKQSYAAMSATTADRGPGLGNTAGISMKQSAAKSGV